ncbi:anti-repressor SinI family protein [Virgibacillus doumboii]|nr:anti-repressor SinI family protein [Virgibacillus doumboii]
MRNAEKSGDLYNEWVELMVEAKAIGLTVEEIRMFLTDNCKK